MVYHSDTGVSEEVRTALQRWRRMAKEVMYLEDTRYLGMVAGHVAELLRKCHTENDHCLVYGTALAQIEPLATKAIAIRRMPYAWAITLLSYEIRFLAAKGEYAAVEDRKSVV